MTFQPPAPGLGRRFLRSPRAASLRRTPRPRSSPDRRSCEAAALTCPCAGPDPPRPGCPARGPGFGGPRLAAAQAPQLPLSPAPG
ncbi:hypothetical protein MC885_003794 [Smutsia gigantea]|nr:hypothetical protein MC885_003794 [Smutsia gigantea]